MTVGEWVESLSEEDLLNLRHLAKLGFSTLEMRPHGQYSGRLPQWTLPGAVEEQMKDTGLETEELRIQRSPQHKYYPNALGKSRKKKPGKEGEP